MTDQFLYEFQKQPSPAFTKRLYARINTPRSRSTKIMPGLAYGFGCFMLGLVLLFSVSPAARVYAQEIIYQIGQWLISHQPTAAAQFENKLDSGEVGVSNISSSEVIEWQAPVWMSADEAEALLGFKVYQLQLNGFDVEPIFREVQTGLDENTSAYVSTVYGLQQGSLVFRQTEMIAGTDQKDLPVGDAEVKQVALLQGDAYWIKDLRLSTYVNEDNKVEPKFANVLVWEDNGFEFWLQTSPGLALEDMLLLARGID